MACNHACRLKLEDMVGDVCPDHDRQVKITARALAEKSWTPGLQHAAPCRDVGEIEAAFVVCELRTGICSGKGDLGAGNRLMRDAVEDCSTDFEGLLAVAFLCLKQTGRNEEQHSAQHRDRPRMSHADHRVGVGRIQVPSLFYEKGNGICGCSTDAVRAERIDANYT